jgi:hydrogenase maturation protein HypF
LFDAAAAITGVCRRATFEGEAAIALEAAACGRLGRPWLRRSDLSERAEPTGEHVLVWNPRYCLARLASDERDGADARLLSARFHGTVVAVLAAMLIRLACVHGVGVVALTGGSVVNSLLRKGLTRKLVGAGLAVYRNRLVPCGDGGVSLGQAVATTVLPGDVLDRG